ncbi:hypothetical protein AB0876_31985 [Mycobacterium sp. NPDC049093]
MTSTVVSSTPVTSWWYGQGGAVGVVRRLEALYTLNPAPAAAGLVTARRDELTVTFIDTLRVPLPQPWHPADSGSEARISWDAVDPGTEPDPQHPVYLVVFGTTDDGGLVAMNLTAFSRIRIDGERTTTTGLVSRWVLELLATHPAITVGVTADVWSGPLTSRVQPVSVGHVPAVDVLICGPDLSYTDRAQIVSNSTSRIMVDLGKDAAVDTKWTISCGPDQVGQISNGQSRAMTATLIDTVGRSDLLASSPTTPASARPPAPADDPDSADEPATDPSLPVAANDDWADLDAASGDEIDFFAPQPDAVFDSNDDSPDAFTAASWPETEDSPQDTAPAAAVSSPSEIDTAAADPAVPVTPVAAAVAPDTVAADETVLPVVAPLWNRLLGQVVLCPPEPGGQPGPREKRLNELLVFLQTNPWSNSSDIIDAIYRGAATAKTVTQQISPLRTRLGNVRPGGPKALPPMQDGGYRLDPAVRSDWMEFERLLEIVVETTPTSHLVAAMNLVTGPPLGTITPTDWRWAKDLREQLRTRVPSAAAELARRHHEARKFSAAVEIARKGLWYDSVRQDLWQVAMQAALDGHDDETFKELRRQYFSAVADPDRDPAVLVLTK